MKVFVTGATGATGLVGEEILVRLHSAGHAIRKGRSPERNVARCELQTETDLPFQS